MSFSVVSVIKQRPRLMTLSNMRMCVMNAGLRNTNGISNRSAMNYYATNVRDKCVSKSQHTSSDLQSAIRCYSVNGSEFDKKHSSEVETERLSDNQGPVRMSITEDGKLQVHIVDDGNDNIVENDDNVNDNIVVNDDNVNENIVENDDNVNENIVENDDNVNENIVENDDNVNDIVNGHINNNKLGKTTVIGDAKLLKLINDNQTDCAIELLQSAITAGKPPHANLVILLFKQLGKNGSVDKLLQLQHIVSDNKLCNEVYFLKSLALAYHESDRIQDAIDHLKTLFENNQDYLKVKNPFIFLTTMILKKFPQWQSDIVSFVNEHKIEKFPKLEKELWKCFVLSENFKEAEKYVKETAKLEEEIPHLVTEINSIIRNATEFSDEEKIWKYLLTSGEDLGLKKGFLLFIYEEYLITLLKKQKFREVILNLNQAKTNGIRIHKKRFDFLSRCVDESNLTKEERKIFKELNDWYYET